MPSQTREEFDRVTREVHARRRKVLEEDEELRRLTKRYFELARLVYEGKSTPNRLTHETRRRTV